MKRFIGLFIAIAACSTATSNPQQSVAGALYKDKAQPIDARVEDLLHRMTLEEKVAQMEAFSPGARLDSIIAGADTAIYGGRGRRLSFGGVTGFGGRGGPRQHAEQANKIQHYFIDQTRLGIPVILTEEALHGVVAQGTTNYPTPPALSSTWDTALVRQVFSQVGLEAGAGGTDLVLAPVLDLAQDPRWGRAEETYGEDPYLNSRMSRGTWIRAATCSCRQAPAIASRARRCRGRQAGINESPRECSEKRRHWHFSTRSTAGTAPARMCVIFVPSVSKTM